METITNLYASIHYSLMALLRFVLVRILPTRVWTYSDPKAVGYYGGIDFRDNVLVFIRDDGTYQYKW